MVAVPWVDQSRLTLPVQLTRSSCLSTVHQRPPDVRQLPLAPPRRRPTEGRERHLSKLSVWDQQDGLHPQPGRREGNLGVTGGMSILLGATAAKRAGDARGGTVSGKVRVMSCRLSVSSQLTVDVTIALPCHVCVFCIDDDTRLCLHRHALLWRRWRSTCRCRSRWRERRWRSVAAELSVVTERALLMSSCLCKHTADSGVLWEEVFG